MWLQSMSSSPIKRPYRVAISKTDQDIDAGHGSFDSRFFHDQVCPRTILIGACYVFETAG